MSVITIRIGSRPWITQMTQTMGYQNLSIINHTRLFQNNDQLMTKLNIKMG